MPIEPLVVDESFLGLFVKALKESGSELSEIAERVHVSSLHTMDAEADYRSDHIHTEDSDFDWESLPKYSGDTVLQAVVDDEGVFYRVYIYTEEMSLIAYDRFDGRKVLRKYSKSN